MCKAEFGEGVSEGGSGEHRAGKASAQAEKTADASGRGLPPQQAARPTEVISPPVGSTEPFRGLTERAGAAENERDSVGIAFAAIGCLGMALLFAGLFLALRALLR